jgi:hypothetical protein
LRLCYLLAGLFCLGFGNWLHRRLLSCLVVPIRLAVEHLGIGYASLASKELAGSQRSGV